TSGYAVMLAARVGLVSSVLDVKTGGGEGFDWVLRGARRRPSLVVATESWAPNVAIAGDRLASQSATVVRADDGGGLPFRSASFKLVASRHRLDRDRPSSSSGRDVLVPAGRCRLQPGAVRVPDGPAAGKPEPGSR